VCGGVYACVYMWCVCVCGVCVCVVCVCVCLCVCVVCVCLCVCVCGVCVCIMRDALQQYMLSSVFFSQINARNHLSTLRNILSKRKLLYCYKYI